MKKSVTVKKQPKSSISSSSKNLIVGKSNKKLDKKLMYKILGFGALGGVIGLVLVTLFLLANQYVVIPNFIAFLCGGVFAGAIISKDNKIWHSLIAGVVSSISHTLLSLINLTAIFPLIAGFSLSSNQILIAFIAIFIATILIYPIGAIIGYGIVYFINKKI